MELILNIEQNKPEIEVVTEYGACVFGVFSGL